MLQPQGFKENGKENMVCRLIVIDLETSLDYLRELISIACLKDLICRCAKLVIYLL